MNKNEVILHGECQIFASTIPATAKKKLIEKGKYLIVADSETTGNHHVVDAVEGVTFFEDNGVMFMDVATEATVRCLHADRHDALTIPAGTYEFGVQQEYDPFTARMQKVRD
jgi:hypothetical protein